MSLYFWNNKEPRPDPKPTGEMVESLKITMSRLKCEEVVAKWHMLLNYQDLNEWFGSNRCCLPITLSRMLDKRIIINETTL